MESLRTRERATWKKVFYSDYFRGGEEVSFFSLPFSLPSLFQVSLSHPSLSPPPLPGRKNPKQEKTHVCHPGLERPAQRALHGALQGHPLALVHREREREVERQLRARRDDAAAGDGRDALPHHLRLVGLLFLLLLSSIRGRSSPANDRRPEGGSGGGRDRLAKAHDDAAGAVDQAGRRVDVSRQEHLAPDLQHQPLPGPGADAAARRGGEGRRGRRRGGRRRRRRGGAAVEERLVALVQGVEADLLALELGQLARVDRLDVGPVRQQPRGQYVEVCGLREERGGRRSAGGGGGERPPPRRSARLKGP